MNDTVKTHDVVRLVSPRSRTTLSGGQPMWAVESLKVCPWAVIRRGLPEGSMVPVGVRGSKREERWSGYVDADAIMNRKTPCDLRSQDLETARLRLPAFRALQFVESALADAGIPWGPIGSVGFELASRRPDVTQESDLDIVLFAPVPFDHTTAEGLRTLILRAPARVDVLVETPQCGFSLTEYAQQAGPLLLRTDMGRLLATDPWHLPATES